MVNKKKLLEKIKELSENSQAGTSRWVYPYEEADDTSQSEMEGYQWALNDIIEYLTRC